MRMLGTGAALVGAGMLAIVIASTWMAAPPGPGGSAPAATAPVPEFTCPATTIGVTTADELAAALAQARPGDVIGLADGTYSGGFTIERSGTPDQPIYLCGGRGAVLQGEGYRHGYVLHLDGAADWRVAGFSVRSGQKGVMVDGGTRVALQGLLVEGVGDEAVHLRRNSTDNVVRGLTIRDTGNRKAKFGEGIYVGSAESNWSSLGLSGPDRSDRNWIVGNAISGTTAENVDLKEGTSGGVLAGNSFDGTGMTSADSWVDVKGRGWLISGNRGLNSPKDGFQTHVILPGWGDANVFTGNLADLGGGKGVGYYVHHLLANRVSCSNTVLRAGTGLSNIPCTT